MIIPVHLHFCLAVYSVKLVAVNTVMFSMHLQAESLLLPINVFIPCHIPHFNTYDITISISLTKDTFDCIDYKMLSYRRETALKGVL